MLTMNLYMNNTTETFDRLTKRNYISKLQTRIRYLRCKS